MNTTSSSPEVGLTPTSELREHGKEAAGFVGSEVCSERAAAMQATTSAQGRAVSALGWVPFALSSAPRAHRQKETADAVVATPAERTRAMSDMTTQSQRPAYDAHLPAIFRKALATQYPKGRPCIGCGHLLHNAYGCEGTTIIRTGCSCFLHQGVMVCGACVSGNHQHGAQTSGDDAVEHSAFCDCSVVGE